MTGAGLIIHPPRAFGVTILLQFDADTRSDAELQAAVFHAVTIALAIAGNVRRVGVVPVAPMPAGVPGQ